MLKTQSFVLYSTAGCHLCDLAYGLIEQAGKSEVVVVVDIVEQDNLVALYGTRIPVLKNQQSGNELGWPFDSAQLTEFLR